MQPRGVFMLMVFVDLSEWQLTQIFNRKSIMVAQFFRIQLPHLIEIENMGENEK